ncbi:DEAD/DEAH box helicase [Photobacterium iliopiscarium]|uniref:DEAD/DEAH box helicase n=1 Tax=Photobacterium iliopiscarium TaxID=56192 RepID=UPI003C6E9F05
MENLINVAYQQTGASTKLNEMGMREMQARAYAARNSQYLLIKAPPASGKSRALMFIGLDKLKQQRLKRLIVAVPEMSIGSSFKNTPLSDFGFFTDWVIEDRNNLCIAGGDQAKVAAVKRFMESGDEILVCTHATLRFAFEALEIEAFQDCALAIDEFHHVSASQDSRLGNLIDKMMKETNAHIVAMTGSYFRGDTVPILLPEDEALFTKVTYTYYEQLNGYEHLKTLGIGYHFYKGRYIDALPEVLDITKKTIIHIPNVNSSESTKKKYAEVDRILDVIGTVLYTDSETGIIHIQSHKDQRIIKVANLVEDDSRHRVKVQDYLRNIRSGDDMDIIIALGMAKEGFDWPWCEHVLTIGYRSSMTEVVQIIGRTTRDCPGKSHAQFTNLISQPDAADEDVHNSVNNMLKAITVSLLMEQILAPSITFKPRGSTNIEDEDSSNVVVVDGASEKVLDILNSGQKEDILAKLMQRKETKEVISGVKDPEVYNCKDLPEVIKESYPDLTEDEVEQLRTGLLQGIVATTSRNNRQKKASEDKPNTQFLKLGEHFINIEELNIDLIEQINPFHGAYEVLSKSVSASMLKAIQDVIASSQSKIDEEEAILLWPRVNEFFTQNGRPPSITSSDPIEKRYAEALAFMREQKAKQMRDSQQEMA